MLEINLPYPPSALSQNARGFWAAKAKAVKKYRRDCWVCAPEILRAWGFKFCSVRTWVKASSDANGMMHKSKSLARGTGYEVAGNAEFLIIAKRGEPQSIKGNPWTSVVISPRREHSRKPDEIRAEIAARLEGPRLELFARSTAPGWEVAGNETAKFGEVAA